MKRLKDMNSEWEFWSVMILIADGAVVFFVAAVYLFIKSGDAARALKWVGF